MRKWNFVVSLVMVAAFLAGCSGVSQDADTAATVDVSPTDLEDDLISPEDILPDESEDSVEQKDVADEDTVDKPPPHPLFGITGGVLMSKRTMPSGQAGPSSIGIRFNDQLPIPRHILEKEAGGCQYWSFNPLTPVCNPECDPDLEWCGEGNVCHFWPAKLSAGEVTIEGLSLPVSVNPNGAGSYASPMGLPGALFEANAAITVTAKGGPDLAGFQGQTSGVGEFLIASGNTYQMEDGKDNVFSWTPVGDGSTVELEIRTGWHGDPPTDIIWCVGPEADGQVVVPQALIEMFPPAGGDPVMQHPSSIRKISRTIVDGDYGPIEISALNEVTFYVTHNE